MRRKQQPMPDDVTHYMLRTVPPGRDLDQYIFQDLEHAVTWLSAAGDYGETHYKVCLVHMKYGKYPCSHCGKVEAYPQIRRTLAVRAFVQQYGGVVHASA